MAAFLGRLIARVGRPAAYRKDAGSALQQAVAWLDAKGRASPCLDALSHAAAGLRQRASHPPPACAPLGSAWGRVSGTRTPTILACLAPPTVRTKARLRPVPRLVPWAERLRQLSPAGAAQRRATCAKLRAGRAALPPCHAFLQRLRAEASGLRACPKMLTTTGRSPNTLRQCEPLIEAMPSKALRRECRASLDFPLETAKSLELADLGVPISAETIAALCGVAKPQGVGQTPDAARSARRLPA